MSLTQYILTPGSSTRGIIEGPDGNMWAVGYVGSSAYVWKINPTTGAFVAYNVGVLYSVPTGALVTDGTDLWFTDVSYIYRFVIATSALNSYTSAVVNGGTAMSLVYLAPYVWVAGYGGGGISSVDSSGTATLYNFQLHWGPYVSFQGSIATDGTSLWATSSDAGFFGAKVVWQINPASPFTNPPNPTTCPAVGVPNPLVILGGNLWIDDESSANIYKIPLSAPTTFTTYLTNSRVGSQLTGLSTDGTHIYAADLSNNDYGVWTIDPTSPTTATNDSGSATFTTTVGPGGAYWATTTGVTVVTVVTVPPPLSQLMIL